MASLHRDPRGKSPYWYCAFCSSNGKRSFKSTKVKFRGENSKETAQLRANAEEICRGWERAGIQGQRGMLTEMQTRKVLSEILERVTGDTLRVVTVKGFLQEWVRSKELSKAEGTARRYRHTVEQFLKHLGSRAEQSIGVVLPSDIAGFRDSQLEQGKTGTTANMTVKTLRIPFSIARKQGLMLVNPAEVVEMVSARSESRDVFTPEQIRSILDVCSEEWRGLVLIARYCGLRLGDAVSLRWDNLQRDGEHLTLRFHPKKSQRGKLQKEHEMPVPMRVEEYLLALKGEIGKPKIPVFPTLSKQRLSGSAGLSAHFQKIMARAGVVSREDTRQRKGLGRSFHNLTFHSLRHTFISRLANAGVAKEIRMKLSGHTSEAHQRYTHHELSTLRAAMRDDDDANGTPL